MTSRWSNSWVALRFWGSKLETALPPRYLWKNRRCDLHLVPYSKRANEKSNLALLTLGWEGGIDIMNNEEIKSYSSTSIGRRGWSSSVSKWNKKMQISDFIRVDCWAFFEQFHGGFKWVDDNQVQTKGLKMNHIWICKHINKRKIFEEVEDVLYSRDHSANFIHGEMTGIWWAFPINGSPLGPGAYGSLAFFRKTISAMKRATIKPTQQSKVVWGMLY